MGVVTRWGRYKTEPQGGMGNHWDDIPFIYAGSIKHPEGIYRGNKKVHPCQMPTDLAARFFNFLVDTEKPCCVLDPFAGSGSSLVAAQRFPNITAYGIEINPAYCALIEKRLQPQRLW